MLRLLATEAGGRVVVDETVPHGVDPAKLLRARGLEPTWTGGRVQGGDVVLHYRVEPGTAPHPHQRIASYAVGRPPWAGVAACCSPRSCGPNGTGGGGCPVVAWTRARTRSTGCSAR